jgi:hypothetical protein
LPNGAGLAAWAPARARIWCCSIGLAQGIGRYPPMSRSYGASDDDDDDGEERPRRRERGLP